jgi:glucokinase
MSNYKKETLRIGLEIGGTKIQVGIGSNNGKLLKVMQKKVIRENGALGIRRNIVSMIEEVLNSTNYRLSDIDKIGIGFGGLVEANHGIVIKSYQIDGWDNFPLKEWSEKQWGKPVIVQNDASSAGLAESIHGSGRDYSRVFYITLGSGVGGGWIVNKKIDNGQGYGAAEIGHTFVPDPDNGRPTELEQICSGWSIGRRARLAAENTNSMMIKMAGSLDQIDARYVYSATEMGDEIAKHILNETCQTLGIAISNVIALLHPERVIIGGGVSLMGRLFWDTLYNEVRIRAMPAFLLRTDVVKAELEENVVVIGALCLE